MPPEAATLPSSSAPGHPRPTNGFIEFRTEEVEQSIPARFERQVDRYPEQPAVKVGTHQLTYTEINRAANRVARAILARRGHGEEPVALLLEHGASLISAILGVLKVGKIYLPLDPSYPLARSGYILEDAGAALIVTNNRHLALAGRLNQAGRPLLNIDELDSTYPEVNLGLPVPPDALAYILYTSGSTGRPKGVVQNHRNVLWDIREYTNTLHISPDDRMTLLYSCSVNGSVRGIFGALLNGASLYPLDIKEEGLNGLADLLSREEITFFHSVPTVFRHFVGALTGTERFPKLRLIRFGGERVLARDVESYRKHFPDDCQLYTGMGATETGHVRHYFHDKRTPITSGVVPTGYAVEGKEVLLLDDAGREVGVGHAGEIAVRSRYLALGYWRKPDLTRAAFLHDPAGGPERIFRTGDMGRMHPDGCLEHLGRKDFQVKVRGYRIEAAEIETALLGLAGVREAVVVAREAVPGEHELVAYVVPEPTQAPTAAGPARAPEGRAAGAHGALGVRAPGHLAAHPEREGGPAGAARARPDSSRVGRDCWGTAYARRGSAGGDLGRSARTGTVEYRGQLLRVGRPLVARHPSSREAARYAPDGPAAAHLLRPSHGGRAGRAHSVGGNRGGSPLRTAHPAGPARRRAAALIHAGAAVVPASVGIPRARPTTSRRHFGSGARST